MRKKALLIGVSDYTYGFTPLASAIKDVQAIKRVLERPDIGDFQELKVLENPDRQSMEEAIEILFANCRKEDLVLLFFSGHGVKDEDGRLYLAACNARKDDKGRLVKSRAVAGSLVVQFMENCRSKRQVIILDCCFSGAFAEGMKAKDDGSVDVIKQLGGEGRVVLSSSSSTQYSFEQQGFELSIYTHFLVEGMETGDADQDRDGFIQIDELHEYAKRRVQETKPEMNPDISLVKEGYKIRLAQTPSTDPVLRYAQEIRQLAHNLEIRFKEQSTLERVQNWLNLPPRNDVLMSPTRRKALDALQRRLGLPQDVASQIEAAELQPYRDFHHRLMTYKQEFARKIAWKKSLTDSDRRELRDLQRALNLRHESANYAENIVLQKRQYLPHLNKHFFIQLFTPTKFTFLFGGLIAILIGIDMFKVLHEQTQKTQSSSPAKEIVISDSTSKSSIRDESYRYFQQAESQLRAEKYQSAISFYKYAVQVNPQIADYHAGMGFAYYKQAMKDQELERNQSTEILQVSPGITPAQTTDSENVLLQAGQDLKLAIASLEEALKIQVTSPNISKYPKYKIYFLLGQSYLALGSENDARQAYQFFNSAIQEGFSADKSWLAASYEERGTARLKFAKDKIGAQKDYEQAKNLYVEVNNGEETTKAIERIDKKISQMQ